MNINSVDSTSTYALSTPDDPPADHAASTRRVAEALRKVSESSILPQDQEFSLSLDPDTKLPIIRIVDSATREIILQVPAEYIVRLASYFEAQELDENQALKLSF